MKAPKEFFIGLKQAFCCHSWEVERILQHTLENKVYEEKRCKKCGKIKIEQIEI